VPGLKPGALKPHIETDFQFTKSGHPRRADEIVESTYLLRVNFHVPSPWTAANGAARRLNRARKCGRHFFAHLFDKLRENAVSSAVMPSEKSVLVCEAISNAIATA
jgi:hypothetical protein